MRIRPAFPKDADGIAALLQAETRRHVAESCTAEGLARLLAGMTASAVRQCMEDNYRYWIALMDGQIGGVCALRGASHLYYLFVASAFHRQGIAARLFENLLDHCRSLHPPTEVLTVNAASSAVPVYLKFGFVAEGVLREQDGVRFQPMRLQLAATLNKPPAC